MKIELNNAKIKSIIDTINTAIVEAASKNQISTTWVFEDVQGQVFLSLNPASNCDWKDRYHVRVTMFDAPLMSALFGINGDTVQGVALEPVFSRLKEIVSRSNAGFEIYRNLLANVLRGHQDLAVWVDSTPGDEVKLDSHDFGEEMKLIMSTEFKGGNISHTQTLVIDNEVAFTATMMVGNQCNFLAAVNQLAAIITPMIQNKLGQMVPDTFSIDSNRLGLITQLLQTQFQPGMMQPGVVPNQMVMNNGPFGPGVQYNPPFNNMNGLGPNF